MVKSTHKYTRAEELILLLFQFLNKMDLLKGVKVDDNLSPWLPGIFKRCPTSPLKKNLMLDINEELHGVWKTTKYVYFKYFVPYTPF